MTARIATLNEGTRMTAEDQVLQVTLAFASYDRVMPAVAGLFRALNGYSRADENSAERQWARLDRLESARGTAVGTHGTNSVRVIEPKDAPDITVIEDFFGTDPEKLGKLLGDVNFLHLYSEYARKSAERHSYMWREGAKVKRHVYFHHNYQEPGWDWEEKGKRLSWEDVTRMDLKRISARCDRALMLDYAARLGCDLHAALAGNAWTRAVLIHQISEIDLSETPAPTTLGEDYRREAVKRGFGQGEEDVSFAGQLADGHFHACTVAHYSELTAAIHKTRSARKLLEVMTSRDIAPDHQEELGSVANLWHDALLHAYHRFPDAAEVGELEDRAKTETAHHRFPLNDLRLENIRRSLTGEPHRFDPGMWSAMFRDWAGG